jgi:lon-related putative ATP-dependent protease
MPARLLYPEDVCRRTAADRWTFDTTEDLAPITEMTGQERAAEALRFGLGIRRKGYNLFVLGARGTGKHTAVFEALERRAHTEPTPHDWCYVQDFDQWHRPCALRLPPGEGNAFRRDLDRLIDELTTAIPAMFRGEEYRARRAAIEKGFSAAEKKLVTAMEETAEAQGVAFLRTPDGFAFTALREGEPVPFDEIDKLDDEAQSTYETAVEALREPLAEFLSDLEALQRDTDDKVDALERSMVAALVAARMEKLEERWANVPDARRHLDAVKRDVPDNLWIFVPDDDDDDDDPEHDGTDDDDETAPILGPSDTRPGAAARRRYTVNVIVDRTGLTGAPVVYEDLPTYGNLVGRVEHVARMGALVTDFRLIKAGSLHKANGGYLVLDVDRLLSHPGAWEGLKHALRTGKARIETLERMLSMATTRALEPEPIPLDVKVVLVGERWMYYELEEADPEFGELFKVAVDFDDDMPRTPETELATARWIATFARRESLRPFARHACARVVDQSARAAGHAARLTTRYDDLADLLREADHVAAGLGHPYVTEDDVISAWEAHVHRLDRLRESVIEDIRRGVLRVEVSGAEVGQVNALAVIDMGRFAFAHPSRVTARVRVGNGEVIDVERETELGGEIHSKGVLILTGWLGSRYAVETPLSLTASLVFEQSYVGVDGDSASSAEAYALLSALAEVPLEQSVAVTGAIDQQGRVQAVGGVNEKIEGFFDVCRALGITGRQGVVIPRANVGDLMLRDDVVEAIAAGRFRVWAVETIDEGIEVLTGLPAGTRGPDGRFPEGTINHRVEARLLNFASRRRQFLRATGGTE